MLVCNPQECPRCEAAIPREHAVTARVTDAIGSHTDRYLYCMICGYGVEESLYDDGDVFVLEYYERTEPDCFGKFLQRFADARAA